MPSRVNSSDMLLLEMRVLLRVLTEQAAAAVDAQAVGIHRPVAARGVVALETETERVDHLFVTGIAGRLLGNLRNKVAVRDHLALKRLDQLIGLLHAEAGDGGVQARRILAQHAFVDIDRALDW
ncbi:MAG: hypothetical protein P8166_17360 [Candidatus Thiodiazotropha sp.]